MTIRQYFNEQFKNDLMKVDFKTPNPYVLKRAEEHGIDKSTIFFGGSDWKLIKKDLERIDNENLDYFLICLFAIILIDLNMYTYYKAHYENFRAMTNYPKFGWSGFGPHFENPKKLLTIPEQIGLTNFEKLNNQEKEFVEMFTQECSQWLNSNTPEIKLTDFISTIINDPALKISEGEKATFYASLITTLQKSIV